MCYFKDGDLYHFIVRVRSNWLCAVVDMRTYIPHAVHSLGPKLMERPGRLIHQPSIPQKGDTPLKNWSVINQAVSPFGLPKDLILGKIPVPVDQPTPIPS
jgi:hypothetical protein